MRNLLALEAELGRAFPSGDAIDWERKLVAAGVPAGRINTVDQVFADPQIVAREMVRHQHHPRAGEVPTVISPMRFANAPLAFDRAAPLLGEHHAEVLAELGWETPHVAD